MFGRFHLHSKAIYHLMSSTLIRLSHEKRQLSAILIYHVEMISEGGYNIKKEFLFEERVLSANGLRGLYTTV